MKRVRRLLAARDIFQLHETRLNGSRMVARRSSVPPRHDGPTVVLLGGTALSGRYLLPVAVELAHRFPVWVPDLAGRGASDAPKNRMTPEDHADHLAAWIAHVGLERVALLGNSMGCQIAVETAVRHPDRVSHLVLQGPTTDAAARSLPRQLVRLVIDGTREPASLGPIEVVDWFRAGVREAVHQVQFTVGHRIEERLPHVACPTLVVRGARDAVVPRGWAARVAELVPDGQFTEIPGTTHAMVYANPLELARVSEAFLA